MLGDPCSAPGTPRGIARHHRRHQPACDACRALHAAQVRASRQNPDVLERKRASDRAAQQRKRGTPTYACPACGSRVGAQGTSTSLSVHYSAGRPCPGAGTVAA